MNFKTIKQASEIKLSGIVAELEKKDGIIAGVTLRDSAGGMLVVKVNNYSVEVLVPAPPKLVRRYRVRGALADVQVDELFEHDFSAKARITELELGANVEPEKVLVEE
jgi:hypothetical protein